MRHLTTYAGWRDLALEGRYYLSHAAAQLLAGHVVDPNVTELKQGCDMGNGDMTLIEAAEIIERLQRRAAHQGEIEALQMARNALLTILSEGFTTLRDRLHPGNQRASLNPWLNASPKRQSDAKVL
ncbi:MAG: hypothetical protein AABY89_00445 [Acidobacteriota bacterium]